MKIFFTILLISYLQPSFAQQDFMILQKRGKTINRFFPGNSISFYTTDGFLISGILKKCQHDSIFMDIPVTNSIQTLFGNVLDTTGYNYYKTNIKNIGIFPAKRFTAAKAGNLLVKAGVLVSSIFLINKINIDNNPNASYAVGILSAAAINVAMAFITPFHDRLPQGYKIGKKYKLIFMNVSNP
ncbi:MAG: hypothetical protein JSS67_11865 [Bacteroidetes bacterium]|nr:hypothetical protein [Bacteroidota bacterium]